MNTCLRGLLIALPLSFCALFSTTSSAVDRRIPVTVATARLQNLEVWQRSHGRLMAKNAPTIAAEVGGRIVDVKVDVGQAVTAGQVLAEIDGADFRLEKKLANADILRFQALIKAQRLQVNRLQDLVRKKSVNRSALDDAKAQLGSLSAQLAGAKVRLQQVERKLSKTRIVSPVNGRINYRKVSVGDFVKTGMPLFQLTELKHLQARLPYPETLASQLHIGLPARLTSPVMPGSRVSGRITEIRPEVSASNLATEVIVDLDNPGGWEPGASVTGEVRVAERAKAVVVPEGCVVRRPSGQVVYRVEGGKAVEVAVTTGLVDKGDIEIRSGVHAGDRLALDGAAYLTNGIIVDVITPVTQGDKS